ncbi:MAG: hypothetical protein AAB562_04260 [Patescibacteria group bacterium]
MNISISPRALSRGSKISGCASVLGSWQICHNLCSSLVAALTTLGFAIQGMPLLFLNRWQTPLWMVALALFGALILLRFVMRMRFITRRSMLGNVGLILAGLPFDAPWISSARTIGIAVAIVALLWYLKERIVKREEGALVLDFTAEGRKVAGGMAGIIALAMVLVIPPAPSYQNQPMNASAPVAPASSHMKFTMFDVAQAKELMDADGDGRCDACGMDIDQCIASGMMQCTMDPAANVGLLGSAHIHAGFQVIRDGKPLDFTPYAHRMGGDDGISSSFIHVHADDGAQSIHMHATGVPLGLFFQSIGMNDLEGKVRAKVNGKEIADPLGYVFQDDDALQVVIQ